jgi:hypothetical protein
LELQVVELRHPDLIDLYQAPLTLIRPDQIVAWRGQANTDPGDVWPLLLG